MGRGKFHINYLTCMLTHWGRVTHICVSELTTIGSDNGLSPERRQYIIWKNAGLLLIEPLGTNFSEISIGIQTFSFTKMHLNVSSAKWCPFCLGLNVLKSDIPTTGANMGPEWLTIHEYTRSQMALGDSQAAVIDGSTPNYDNTLMEYVSKLNGTNTVVNKLDQ